MIEKTKYKLLVHALDLKQKFEEKRDAAINQRREDQLRRHQAGLDEVHSVISMNILICLHTPYPPHQNKSHILVIIIYFILECSVETCF